MKKIILLVLIFQTLFLYYGKIISGELKVTSSELNNNFNYKKAYFAGGCFWCMEESFDKVNGVIKSISGYSGGKLKNPTYKEVIYKDTGHIETIEITYDPKKVSYEKLVKVFWKNIDPFDKYGQFWIREKAIDLQSFFRMTSRRILFNNQLMRLKKFNSKVVTLVWKFKKFYVAEDYHQDYYQKNFLRYLAYKKACQREEVLNKIWN